MTFTDIVNRVANRTNVTSSDGLTLIGTFVNDRYREVMSSIGVQKSARTTVTATTTIGNRDLVFNCEKIFALYDTNFTPFKVLQEFSYDELLNGPDLAGSIADRYAIHLMGASTVTVFLGGTPSTQRQYTALAEVNIVDLSGTDVPAFSADFHDVLYRGAYADQLDKMEKYDKSDKQEKKFEKRLGELRLFQATSAYLRIYQGKESPERIQRVGLV